MNLTLQEILDDLHAAERELQDYEKNMAYGQSCFMTTTRPICSKTMVAIPTCMPGPVSLR